MRWGAADAPCFGPMQTSNTTKPSMATLPELPIAAAVIAAFDVIWLSYIAEQKGYHTLPVSF
jgi:hypothetical protein